ETLGRQKALGQLPCEKRGECRHEAVMAQQREVDIDLEERIAGNGAAGFGAQHLPQIRLAGGHRLGRGSRLFRRRTDDVIHVAAPRALGLAACTRAGPARAWLPRSCDPWSRTASTPA